MLHRRLASALLTCIAFASGAASAQAGPIGSQFQVSTTTIAPGDGTPGNPGAAYDPNLDRYLVVWSSEQESPGTIALWGRFVTGAGATPGPAFKVLNSGSASNDGFDATNARLVYSEPLRKYFVAFRGNQTADNHELMGQWLNGDGTKSGGLVVVSSSITYPDWPTVVANDVRGGVSVIYQGIVSGESKESIQGATVTPGGVTDRKRVSPNDGGRYLLATSAVNETTGDIGITSVDESGGQTNGNGEMVVFRVGADLTPIGGLARPLPFGQNVTWKPSIAWNAKRNEYAVAWSRRIDGHAELWTARYSAGLALQGTPAQVSNLAPAANASFGATSESAIVASPVSDQYYAMVLGDTTAAGFADDQYEIWGRPLGGDLTPTDGQQRVSVMAPGSAVDSDILTGGVAYDSTHDRWLVPWAGKLAGGGLQAFARLVEPVRPAAAAPAAPVAPAAAPCAGQQAYAAKTGTVCAPAPVPAFQVGVLARGKRILRLLVRPTAKGQKVAVLCRAKCARHARKATRSGRKRQTWVTVKGAGLKSGSTVELRITAKGATTRYRQYRVLARRPFLKASLGGCRVTTKLLAADC